MAKKSIEESKIKFVDFHTHILPEMDDGAKNVDVSLELINSVSKLGASAIVLSSHYYPAQERIKDFIHRRNKSCEKLASALEGKENVPRLHLASEVYLEPIIFNNDDLTALTVDKGGNFMLTELIYETEFTSAMESMLRQLVYSYNIIPILAHIDRYPFLMKEKNLYRVLEMGCVAQVNISALASFFKRKKLIKYIEKGYIGAFGTDVHNKSYLPKIKEGRPS